MYKPSIGEIKQNNKIYGNGYFFKKCTAYEKEKYSIVLNKQRNAYLLKVYGGDHRTPAYYNIIKNGQELIYTHYA